MCVIVDAVSRWYAAGDRTRATLCPQNALNIGLLLQTVAAKHPIYGICLTKKRCVGKLAWPIYLWDSVFGCCLHLFHSIRSHASSAVIRQINNNFERRTGFLRHTSLHFCPLVLWIFVHCSLFHNLLFIYFHFAWSMVQSKWNHVRARSHTRGGFDKFFRVGKSKL